jgi:hypothetical protein
MSESIESSVCCIDLEKFPTAKSPFSRQVALGFYDGPTSGMVQCEVCSAVYRFLMMDWDDRQEVRVFSLASLPVQSLEQVIQTLSPYDPPSWPLWFPKWQFPSNDIRQSVDRRIDEILATAEPPRVVVAWSRYGETILAAKSVDQRDIEEIQDWFAVEDRKSQRDWFSFLGLER